jgi:hypothetical protein
LDRLRKILELNRTRGEEDRKAAADKKTSPEQVLTESWQSWKGKCQEELVKAKRKPKGPTRAHLWFHEEQIFMVVDQQLLFSYFVLTSVSAFVCGLVLALLPYSFKYI